MPTLTARGAGEEHSGMKLIKETFPNDKMSGGGLLIKNATKQGYLPAQSGDGIDISTRMQHHRGTVQKGRTQTLTCQGGESVGVVVENEQDIGKTL